MFVSWGCVYKNEYNTSIIFPLVFGVRCVLYEAMMYRNGRFLGQAFIFANSREYTILVTQAASVFFYSHLENGTGTC